MSEDVCPTCHGMGGYVQNPEAIGNADQEPVLVICECARDFWRVAINNNRASVGLPPQVWEDD